MIEPKRLVLVDDDPEIADGAEAEQGTDNTDDSADVPEVATV